MGHPACGATSDRADFLGLRPLGAPAGGELDPLVVLEAAVTVNLDGGVVNEDVGSAVVGDDETVALVGVEPLHCALSHCASPAETTFGIRVCGSPAAAAACLSEAGMWNPWRPLSELRRRCD